MDKKIGFIGCGNMGGALALAAAKSVSGGNIWLSDAFSEKAEELASKIKANVSDTKYIAENCDYIFLGVKPQGFDSLFDGIRGTLMSRSKSVTLITMAAGLCISRIEELAACDCAVIRIMPNTPASVGEGMILYCSNASTTTGMITDFKEILSQAGMLDDLPEEKIDAASALSGCGPAFVYMFAEALADGAVECGLARDKANLYAAQTLLGASKLLLGSGIHPGKLKDAVCSPGGTTIEGVRALEEGAFRASAMNAVIAAYEKTLKLKK